MSSREGKKDRERRGVCEPMTTAGVDLASQASNTGYCEISWSSNGAAVVELASHLDDDRLSEVIARVTKVGIDVPLGWPRAFVDAVSMHYRNGSWPKDYQHADNVAYRLRQTDVWARKQLGTPPLSVSTDRIAIPAMRAAAVLSRLERRPVLDGSGVVVEVYPAGALGLWGLKEGSYKGKAAVERRRDLVQRVVDDTRRWLTLSQDQIEQCVADDNAFDALIAALVARAAAIGETIKIPKKHHEVARREGWIALPTVGSLDRLVP